MGRQLRSLERRKQSRRQNGRKKGRGLPLFFLLCFVIVLGAGGFYVYQEKYAPSKEHADLKTYFGVSGNEVAIFLNDEQEKDKKGDPVVARCVNGGVFLPFEWVMDTLNRRFYYESDANSIYYTTQAGTEIYTTDTLIDGATPFIKMGDSSKDLYLNVKLVEKYTDLRYQSFSDSEEKRVFLYTDWKAYTEATVNAQESVRLLGGIKSSILTTLPKESKVKIRESMDTWSQVVTSDGFIGYLRNSRLKDRKEVTPKSDFVKENFQYRTRTDGQKVVLGFHQVLNKTANNGFENVSADTPGMNTIAPTWFVLTDNAGGFENHGDASYVAAAHQKGLQVYATVNNFEKGKIAMDEVLGKAANRQNLIDNLIAQAKALGLDGLNIDFETVPESCGRSYVQFMREFGNAAHAAELTASADVYVPFDYNKYYDIEEIGKFLDYVIVMCYDEHYAGGEAGSVSSIGYVERGIERSTEQMDRSRVIIAVPFYTRVWKTDANGKTSSDALGAADALKWAQSKGAQFTWDEELKQNYTEITENGVLKKCWMEDEKSMAEKMNAVREADVGGVAAWKLGQEPADFWPLLNLNSK